MKILCMVVISNYITIACLGGRKPDLPIIQVKHIIEFEVVLFLLFSFVQNQKCAFLKS